MDAGKNRPSRPRSRLYSLSMRPGLLTMEESLWNKSLDETGHRRYSDSEDLTRPTQPIKIKSGQ